ncbi:(d)CMP kinase [bacterium]|nr:(d)CMP kinase [bacterium]NBW56856.1 (d)CMP kinase [bacterium]NBX72075.1 (d)CMP kinase [bacterium]
MSLKEKLNIITIDGPACSGKGTLARMLANKLNYFHFDSGLLYRAVGYIFFQTIHQPHSKETLEKELEFTTLNYNEKKLSLTWRDKLLNDDLLRSEHVSRWASLVAQEEFVRAALLPIQRDIAHCVKDIVADGRDMGTIVFPQAAYKFYLTASLEIRAQRRFLSEQENDLTATFEKTLHQLQERDLRDTQRLFAPLRKPENAIEIDTSLFTIQQSLDLVLKQIEKA